MRIQHFFKELFKKEKKRNWNGEYVKKDAKRMATKREYVSLSVCFVI